jgi:hypothetical protein
MYSEVLSEETLGHPKSTVQSFSNYISLKHLELPSHPSEWIIMYINTCQHVYITVFPKSEISGYRVFPCKKLDFLSPTKTCIRISGKLSCTWRSHAKSFPGLGVHFLLIFKPKSPIYVQKALQYSHSWWWNCTTVTNWLQTSSCMWPTRTWSVVQKIFLQ